jgi:hypothetical protein
MVVRFELERVMGESWKLGCAWCERSHAVGNA